MGASPQLGLHRIACRTSNLLQLSQKTVKNHVSSIISKLQVTDRTEAAILATRHGLTDRSETQA